MPTVNKTNNISAPQGNIAISNAKYISAFIGNSILGDNDMYTVPAGKLALISSFVYYNTTGSSIIVKGQVNVSGTYYRLTNGITVSNASINTSYVMSIILNAGEILSFNSAAAGINGWANICEFDAANSNFTRKGGVPTAATTTYYTAPTGKSAACVSNQGILAASAATTNVMFYQSTQSSSMSMTTWEVAPAGSSTNNNLLERASPNSSLVTTNGRTQIPAGYFIQGQGNNTATTRFFWFNLMETY